MAISDIFYIDQNGLVTPDYPTVLAYLQNEYKLIYGADVYLEADSQDGQWVAVQALALFDTMQVASKAYSSFSPSTAQSDALSRNVKLNGIRRRSATYSTADVVIIGQAGTVITNGQAEDVLGQKWMLPETVTLPLSGSITVTVTAETIGAISAAANTINKIVTPTLGWQSVNNVLAAVEGVAVETDAELRKRQTVSTSLPSLSVLDGVTGLVASLDGVTKVKTYENDTNSLDINGLPAHSIALVVEGGDAQDIGDAIARKKTAGTGTHGTTSVDTVDVYGMPSVIKFFRPEEISIQVEVTISPLAGYLTGYAELIKQAVAASINTLDIGDDVLLTKLYVPANLAGQVEGATFDISLLRTKKSTGSFGVTNLTIAYNQMAVCTVADVTVIVS